jgi:indole-3-glycerol phosphate synthase
MTILDTILEHKRVEVAARKAARPLSGLDMGCLDVGRASAGPVREFRGALLDPRRPAPRVIAEVKRRSPSKGPLRPDLDPAQVASIYEANGAAAVSVLTDERFFDGSPADLAAAREVVSVPVLCKDFVVDPYQIYEAYAAGAHAILLIAAVLDRPQLREYREVAESLGMAALVEVHDAAELEAAVESDAGIIGINNRDLRTFEVSLETTGRLLHLIPPQVVTVSESGIRDAMDREMLARLGVDAILVGEGLITAPDIATATREMCGIAQAVLQGSSR